MRVVTVYLRLISLFLYILAQASVASQILHDGRPLHHLSIHIFVKI